MQARAEHNALIARRNEIKEQLEALTRRRGDLAQERLLATARVDAGATADKQLVTEYSARIDEMGARITRLERISENQRYITMLLTERESQKLPVGER